MHLESGKGSDLSSVILLSSPQHFSGQSAPRSFDLDDTGLGQEPGLRQEPGPGPGLGLGPEQGPRNPRKVNVSRV